MKKTLKTLSVLAFGSLAILSGASYAKAYNDAVTYDISTTANEYTGDINTYAGLQIVNQEITLYNYDTTTNTTTEYKGVLKVNISTYENATDVMSSGYDIDWSIDMTNAVGWTNAIGSAMLDNVQVVISVDDGNPYAYKMRYDTTTQSFVPSSDLSGAANAMDLEKSNSTMRITVLNDPTATSSAVLGNVDSNPFDWQYGSTYTAFTQTFNLMDLDSSIEQDDAPVMYGNELITYDATANTIDIEFNLYTNGYDLDGIYKEDGTGTSPNTGSINLSGYLMIPFTKTINGQEYTYFYSVLVTGAVLNDGSTDHNVPYSFITYDDGLHNDGAANDGNYRVVLANSTTAATEDVFDLSTATYFVVDPYDSTIDGTPSTAYSFMAPVWSNDAKSSLKQGNLTDEVIDPGATSVEKAEDGMVVNYEDSFFIPQVEFKPVDAEGNVIAGFDWAPTYIQSVNKYQPPYEPVNTLGAGAITGIVIGSIAAAALFGFGGYWYSHKHHLKGKYDHHHLERLKAHVAKLEKTVAMDDKKAAEWDAKHHIDHKDTKKKK